MSIESKIGHVARNVSIAIADSVCSNLAPLLKNEMNLSNEQITKIFSVARTTIENTGINAVGQYVSLFNDIKDEVNPTTKKAKFFG